MSKDLLMTLALAAGAVLVGWRLLRVLGFGRPVRRLSPRAMRVAELRRKSEERAALKAAVAQERVAQERVARERASEPQQAEGPPAEGR
jgi:hypothetical protein